MKILSGLIAALTQRGNLYNTNIDDVSNFGIYRLGEGNSSSGDHVLNWGLLIVLNTEVYDGTYQIHITNNGAAGVYIRSKTNEDWDSWYKI